MARFILSYRGQGPKPAADVDRLVDEGGAKVVDSLPRMVLVEGEEARLRHLIEKLPDWTLSVERHYGVPDPHPSASKVKKRS